MFVDILSFCSLSVLFCLFLHPPSFIFYVFLFLSFVLSLFIGDTITTIPCLFNYKCIMFKSSLIVVWQPSGYMVRAFHWQYGDILLAIYFLSLLITLYCLWKINILLYYYYRQEHVAQSCSDKHILHTQLLQAGTRGSILQWQTYTIHTQLLQAGTRGSILQWQTYTTYTASTGRNMWFNTAVTNIVVSL